MAEISDLEKQEIERYLKWGEKELFRELDRYHSASMPGGRRASYRVRGRGRVWFNKLLPRLRELICEEWGYGERKDDPQLQDKQRLVMAVGELLMPFVQRHPFPTRSKAPHYLVSAILVQMDLEKLCDAGDS